MIDQYPPANGVLTSLIWRKTMSGGETSLSGYDNASQALSYTPGQEQVYLNGILLVRGDDYTATNGTSITGLSALAANDFVQVNCYNNFSVATLPTSGLTGTISNAQLQNSSITINGSAVSLGGSTTIAGGSAQDDAPTSPTEGQLWLDTNGTLATTGFTEKSTLTTTGDIYYASAANTPARLGIGSTNQVLTVSGGVPSWATPSSGGMTLLSSTSLSGGTTTISSISQDYTDLWLFCDDASISANAGFSIYFNSDTTATNYRTAKCLIDVLSTITGEENNNAELFAAGTSTGWSSSTYFWLHIPRYSVAENHYAYGQARTLLSVHRTYISNLIWNSSNAITAISFANGSTRTWSSGTVRLYGVK